ncbi:hypothetical protein BU26DRAFT_109453 [Trematosphaeria pertusa]|uniref:IDI-2 n=1 Tax=Trematosphaeria pertusa TaxID=390896 RepID=A0A6A6HZZ1_9PLEO|nr:uncharacterized protein BU26DRAFT_109453 [Trematosphaeria pertusa]KAF2243804.1 hypothetical protein BU26DRAFT_109453 [Trematosphaeria pertusa]
MKSVTALVLVIGAAIASASPEANICANEGGLYNITQLPEGATYHRKCAAHPLGEPSAITNLHKRACAARRYGCEKGYCWKKCSTRDGPWCRQAFEYGVGDWVRCGGDSDCVPENLARADCGICDEPSCGCSC